MPTYRFKDKNTNREWDEFMSMSERETFLAENPHINQIPNAGFAYVDSVRLGRTKPAQGFRDLLKQIKKNSGRRSTINDY